ncbi:RagB/SusD family nutrient uptake outer membrane protein [Winogradskyella sp.]|uniref:RagB/SusD family nutrient uptake outer membrane protein n=1 Tax=Winogradskyella sp. TaxID=1883156 RepID=UPI002629CEF7|nr:RagB/SusD family nutrient uptake outer membrane protein [Winogradskyella sp.]
MKKNVIYLFMLAALVFSCEEDFLDPVRDSSVLLDAEIAENVPFNPGLIEASLDGIGVFMIDDRTITGTRHHDFGQKGIDIFMDIVCGDAALSGSAFGWYNDVANMITTTDFTTEENEFIWSYYYRVINTANTVIVTSGGENPSTTDETTLRINAQAKAYRAYSYFYLAQLFQPAYDPNQEILPFNTVDEVNPAKIPASVIYDQILSDLNFALNNLGSYVRPSITQIDQSVINGLLAYTHAAMGNWADARTHAEAVITSGYPLATAGALAFPGAGSGFNDVAAPNWIWGFDLTAEIGQQLINWWGQMDFFTYSYAWAGDTKSIDNLLYSQIPADDIRSTQFGTGAAQLQPINKFFDPGRTAGGQFVITTDYIFMRVEEFYLLSAEASARLGDEASAKNRLTDLLEIRFSGGTAAATSYLDDFTGPGLIDEIYFQTRVEMWGEGKSYFALKRNQATMTRGTNHVFRPNESFVHDSDEISFQIPEIEIINNPNISSQNN